MNYCFDENRDFSPVHTEKGRGFIRKQFDSEELRNALKNIDSLFDNAEIFKDSHTTKAGITKLNDQEIFIKRFNNKGLTYSLKYIFRKPRPFRVWRAAWALEQAGIPTPKLMAAIAEFRNSLFPLDAYIIREVVPEIIPTLDFFKIILKNQSLRKNFIESASAMFAKMHNSGIYHGDAKCSNIYISKNHQDGSYQYGVWDLLSCRLENNAINTTLRNKEIARFANSFAEITSRLEETLPEDANESNIFKIYSSIQSKHL